MNTSHPIPQLFGFDATMQQIFELLLYNNHLSINEIVKKTGLSRATVSTTIKHLRENGIVHEQRLGRFSHISVAHPRELERLIEKKQAELNAAKEDMHRYIQEMTGAYQLLYHGPGVRFVEGVEAVQELLHDSLTAKDEILTITDHDAVEHYAKQLNTEYVSARLAAGIRKRMLLPDSPAARSYAAAAQSELTDIRLLDPSFKTQLATEIYNDSVSVIVATDLSLYGWLITQPMYAEFQKNIFELLWKNATQL